MQKWMHASLGIVQAKSSGILKIYATNGVQVFDLKPTEQKKPTNDELRKWFDDQICRLGDEGWEMINSQYDNNFNTAVLWFKRPVQD